MRGVRGTAALWAGIALGLLPQICAKASADISISNPSVAEGNSGTTPLPFAITRGGDTGSQVILQFQTVDGTAIAPDDYVSLPSTALSFPSSATSATVNVLINGDTVPENDESFFLHLSGAVAVGPNPSFGGLSSFPSGDYAHHSVGAHRPISVALGDINGDGDPDIAVANSSSMEIGVLLNVTAPGPGNPSFSAPVIFSFTDAPDYVVLGDVNGDGRPDLVVASTGVDNGNVSVLINTTSPGSASPSFAPAASFLGLTGCEPHAVALGDINGDGKPDIAVACFASSTVVVLLNNTAPGATTPSFAAAGSVSFGGFTLENMAMSDFNGDGKPDLVLTNSGGRVFVLINTTTLGAFSASFGAIQTFDIGPIPTSVAVGDVNGDGLPDIVVSCTHDANPQATTPPARVVVLLNTTTPGAAAASFTSPSKYLTYGNAYFVVLSDINGDGKLDLAVATLVQGPGAVLETFINITPPGAVTPRFQDSGGWAVSTTTGWVMSIAAGDINGDGKPDFVMSDYNNDTVPVLLNNTALSDSTPAFGAAGNFSAGASPASVVMGDINGDGIPDLTVANRNGGNVSVLLSTTSAGSISPTFAAASRFAAASGPSSVALSDLNDDGKPDLAVANADSNNVSVLLNTTATGATAPGFASASNFTAGTHPSSVVAGDLNGDGKPELVVANHDSNNISVLLNAAVPGSTANFTAAGTLTAGNGPSSVVLGDFNGDGKLDLAVANQNSNNVSVLLNATAPGASTTTFSAASNFAAGAGSISITTGDINGDGKLDIAVANENSNNVTVLLNATAPGGTTPSFAAATNFAAGTGPTSVVLRDVNNDGKLDLVVTDGAGNSVSVLLNTTAPGATTATFVAARGVSVGTGPSAVAVGDINGDGQNDLLVANAGDANLSVLLNQMYTVRLLTSNGVGTILDDDSKRTPATFTFTAQSNVPTNTLVVSNAITVSGINVSVQISVTGGEYSVDGGTFTSSAGSINNGQSVRVRHTSAPTPSTGNTTMLTIGGVSGTFTSTTASSGRPNTTPDPFTFANQQNVPASTVIVSNPITVSGISAPAPMSVTGGEYSVDGGGFISAAGSINNGQSVRVRHTSAPTPSTGNTTTLTIGGVNGTFTSNTAAPRNAPDAFAFTNQQGVTPGTLVVSNSVTITGINTAAPISVTGGEYSIDGGAFTSASGSIANLQTVRVRLTASSMFSTTSTVTLTVGGVNASFQATTSTAPSAGDSNGGGGSLSSFEGVLGLLLGLFNLRRRKPR